MSTFLSLLSESSVVFIPDLAKYGWAVADESVPTPGYEAQSPAGEIKCFDTFEQANQWRVAEILEILPLHQNQEI